MIRTFTVLSPSRSSSTVAGCIRLRQLGSRRDRCRGPRRGERGPRRSGGGGGASAGRGGAAGWWRCERGPRGAGGGGGASAGAGGGRRGGRGRWQPARRARLDAVAAAAPRAPGVGAVRARAEAARALAERPGAAARRAAAAVPAAHRAGTSGSFAAPATAAASATTGRSASISEAACRQSVASAGWAGAAAPAARAAIPSRAATSACEVDAQYCLMFSSGVASIPPTYGCLRMPAACQSTPTCSCLQAQSAAGAATCTETAPGALRVSLAAP